jgi:hypothetical protein
VADSLWGALKGFFHITETPAQHWEGDDVGFQEPREPQFVVNDPLAVVTHMDAMGYDGKAALFTAIDKRQVPAVVRPTLVDLGAARWQLGDPSFKRRRHLEPQNEGERRLLDVLMEAESDREGDPDDELEETGEGGA